MCNRTSPWYAIVPSAHTKVRPFFPEMAGHTLSPHPEERRVRHVSKDDGPSVASCFETPALRAPHHEGRAAYLYASGSGESVGLANSFFSSGLIGVFRFSPFGGTFWVNHLS